MGFFSGLLMVGAAGLVMKGISDSRKEREEEERRKNTPCKFTDITKDEFAGIVNQAINGIKRKKIEISIAGPIIKGKVKSQSGLSVWGFSIDFNDYGRISGKYWLRSENSDSSIPEHIAEEIKSEIIKLI